MANSNPTTQIIDSIIVSLLGLQNDLELSHEDYFRALREASIAARLSGSKFSSEEISLITEELKRIKKEDKNIKFHTEKKKVRTKPKTQKVYDKKTANTTKPKPKANRKVTALSTFVQNPPASKVAEPPSGTTEVSPKVPLLPQPKKKTVEVKEKKQKIKKEDCCQVLGKKLTTIDSTLGSILSTLQNQFSLQKKDSERNRRGREKSKRDDSEKNLEKGSGLKDIANVAKNLLSPFQDIFDRIKRFIVFTLLGKAFTMFMDWMKDPKNRQTFFTITKFLTDHWVLIVGSYLLFGTKLGGFVRSISKLVIKLSVRAVMATAKLVGVLAKSKWGRIALAGAAVAGGAVAISQMGKGKDKNADVEKYADGGVVGNKKNGKSLPGIGILGKALEYSPLGMGFKAAKFGVETLGKAASGVGKAASGAAGLVGKGLQKSLNVAALPLTIGFKGLSGASEFLLNGLKSLDIFKLLASPIQSIQKKGGDKDPKLAAAGGIPGLIGLITQKTSEGIGKNVKDSKKTKTNVEDKSKKGQGYAKGGVINPLLGAMFPAAGLMGSMLSPLMQSKKIGGEHGVPVSGAGKDDRLLKVRTGDAILTEKDQKLLSSGKAENKVGGPIGALTSLFSGKDAGKETVIAAKKGEAVVTQEDQKSIFEKTGINIPSLLAGRKSSKVSSDQLKTKSGNPLGGFFNGGIVRGFAGGGIVGSDGWMGGVAELRSKYDAKHGDGAYDKESARRKASLRQQDTAQEAKRKQKPTYVQSDYVKELKERAKTQGTTSTLSINGMRVPGGGALLQGATSKANELKNLKFDPSKIDVASIAKSATNNLKNKFTKSDSELNAEWNKKALEKKRPWWDKAGLFGGGSRVAKNEAAAKSKQDQKDKREQQINQKARDEYNKILDDMDHPDHEKAWDDGKGYMQSLKKKFGAEPPPGSKKSTAKPKPKPKQSKDGGIGSLLKKGDKKDGKGGGLGSLLKKGAKGALSALGFIGKNKPAEFGFNAAKSGAKGLLGAIGGLMQGGKSKPKGYFSSSDQKYYKDYNAATSARQTRLTSLESQQRLNKLSSQGANRSSRGVRFDAESKSRGNEVKNRGGAWGQIGRSFTKVFGGEQQKQQLALQDKASSSRIKQAGAASIGRYYSSSDGKYYKDYNAAAKAKQARIAAAPKPIAPKPIAPKPIAPKPIAPKPQVAGGGMGGRRGSGSSPGGLKPKVSKKEGGGLVEFTNQAKLLRGITEQPEEEKTFHGMKIFDMQKAFKDKFSNIKNQSQNKSKNKKEKAEAEALNLRALNSNKLKPKGNTKTAFNRNVNLNPQKLPFGTDLGLNIPGIKSNYKLDKVKNNTSLAFNPNVNLNPQKPKRQSIADSLKEIREMRAKSLDRQGKALEATTVRASNYNFPKIDTSKLNVDPQKAYGVDLKLNVPKISTNASFKPLSSDIISKSFPTAAPAAPPKPAPPPPKIDSATGSVANKTTDAPPPPKIVGMKGGGIVGGIKNFVGGFIGGKKKRDIVKAAATKTVSKGDLIKEKASTILNAPTQKKKGGFWSNVYDKVSSVNTAINTGKGILETGKGFISKAPKGLMNFGKNAIKKVALNPKAIKAAGAFSKFGGRMVPGLGIATSAADAAGRAERGDKLGAALAGIGAASGATTLATSGAAATGVGAAIPAVSEAVSIAADVALLGKDLADIAFSSNTKGIKPHQPSKPKPKQGGMSGNKFLSKRIKAQGFEGGGMIQPPNYSSAFTQQSPIAPEFAPSTPLLAPPPPVLPQVTSTPATPKAPAKKSIMQQQAEELRAMRANSLERQGRTSEAYGTRAFNTDMSSFFAKGSVMEDTGVNMPGGTADRQLTALQPGEYVIPKQTVNSFGGSSFFDNMVAKTDSDSNPAKLGAKTPSKIGQNIKPYELNNSNKKPNITNLGSAKEARSGAQRSQGSTPNGSSKEVFFEALCQDGSAPSERQRIMDLLGVNSQ